MLCSFDTSTEVPTLPTNCAVLSFSTVPPESVHRQEIPTVLLECSASIKHLRTLRGLINSQQ